MSGPRTKKTRPPHPPRDVLKKISGAEVLEAGGSILPQFVALVFEGFRQASSHVTAAHQASLTHKSVGKHLKPYFILASCRTTINHAFASAIAPSDMHDDEQVRRCDAL